MLMTFVAKPTLFLPMLITDPPVSGCENVTFRLVAEEMVDVERELHVTSPAVLAVKTLLLPEGLTLILPAVEIAPLWLIEVTVEIPKVSLT